MLKFTYAGLLAAPLLLTACSICKEPIDLEPGTVQCAGTSPSAAGRVVVQYREQLGAAGPAPTLLCRDDSRHTCGNYSLPYTLTTAANSNLGISFGAATAPVICLTTLDYARNQIDLSTLSPGTYAVAWQAAGRQTTGSIRLLPDRVEVTSCDTNTVAVRTPITYRIPATTVWGQSYARTPAAQAAVAVVLDSLRREGATPITLPAGHYSYFEVGATGQLIPISTSANGQPASAIVTPVLLSYSGNFARLKGVIKRRPQAADLSFGVQSAKGENAW